MAAIAGLCALSACRTAPAPTPPPRPASATAKPEASSASTPTATAPQSPYPAGTAIVADETSLLAIEPGAEPAKLLDGDISWCVVDDRLQVVWILELGEEAESLAVYDLVHGTRHVVARGIPQVDEIIIDHGEEGRLGGSDPVSYSVALKVSVSETIEVGPEIGCDGDAAWYCYEEDLETLNDDVQALYDAIAAVQTRPFERAGELVARAQTRRLIPDAPDAPELPRVESVPEKACTADPEACGTASALPGTPFWLVVVSNERGDYFHEDEQLYDPRSQEFVDPLQPTRRAKFPKFDESTVEGMHVAAVGGRWLHAGRLVELDGGVSWGHEDTTTCGFVGGSWRVAGPRG